MKRILCLVWMVLLCLSLCACGESTGSDDAASKNSDSADLRGEWRRISDGLTISFEDNGNCVYNGTACKYEYNQKLETVSVYAVYTINLQVKKQGEMYTLTVQDSVFVPVAYYEDLHADYIRVYTEKNLPPLIEGRTELQVGKTYTTADGMSFTFEKAELLVAEDKCQFSVSFACEKDFDIGSAKYNSPRNTAGFTLVNYSRDGKITQFISGIDLNKAKVEQDAADYGILSFSIGETKYYITAKTFF